MNSCETKKNYSALDSNDRFIPNNTQSLHEPDVKSLDTVFANTVKSNLKFCDVCSFNDIEFNLHKFRCRNMIMIKSHQFTTLRGTTEEENKKKRRLPIKVDDAIYQVIAFIHKTIPVI